MWGYLFTVPLHSSPLPLILLLPLPVVSSNACVQYVLIQTPNAGAYRLPLEFEEQESHLPGNLGRAPFLVEPLSRFPPVRDGLRGIGSALWAGVCVRACTRACCARVCVAFVSLSKKSI